MIDMPLENYVIDNIMIDSFFDMIEGKYDSLSEIQFYYDNLLKIESGKIPDRHYISDNKLSYSHSSMAYATIVSQVAGMWATVDKIFSDRLAKYLSGRKVLEVMSGKGWLSESLRLRGIDIIPTDSNSTHQFGEKYCKGIDNIEKIDAISSLTKYLDEVDVVIMSWCPNNDPIDLEVLKTIDSHPDRKNKQLILISEGRGGITGTDELWDYLEYNKDSIRVQDGNSSSLSWYPVVESYNPLMDDSPYLITFS